MQRMVMKKEPYLLCVRRGCCASAKFELVERRVLDHLEDTLTQIRLEQPVHREDLSLLEDTLSAISRELQAASRQKTRLHELLELGEYDLATYRERMAAVKAKLEDLECRQSEAQLRLDQAASYDPSVQAANIQAVLDAYHTSDAAHKNALLHTVIEQIMYRKEKKTKPAEFELDFILKTH